MRLLILGAALAMAGCSQPAQPAKAPAEAVKAADTAPASPALAGSYVFAGDNLTAAACNLTLEGSPVEGTPGLYGVTLGQALVTAGVSGEVPCAEAYPVLAGLTGWGELAGGGIRLVGAQGATMGEFQPADGRFDAIPGADGLSYGLIPEAVWNNPQ